MGRFASALAVGLILVSCSALRATPVPSNYGNGAHSAAPTTAATTPPTGVPDPTTEHTLAPSVTPNVVVPESTPPLLAPAVEALQLPSGAVQTLSLAGVGDGSEPIRHLYQDADLFFFSKGRTVYGFQFAKGRQSPDVIARAQDGQQVLGIDGGTSDWVWATGRYDETTGRVPCNEVGALSWELVHSNPVAMFHPEFVNSRIRFCTAAPPMFAMDGMRVAVAVEAPREGHPQAWDIRLMSSWDGTLLRTIETDGDLFSLDLSGEDVAYIEGDLDVEIDPYTEFNTRLLLSTANNPELIEIAKDAYGVSFSGGRLAWKSNPQSSQRDETAAPPALMTASTADHTPQVLTTDPQAAGAYPVAAGDVVTWSAGGQVFLWNANTNVVWQVEGKGDAGNPSARGGWLTWVGDDTNGIESLNAIELATLFPPVPTPTPTPSAPATPIPPASVASPEPIVVDGMTWMRREHDGLPELRGVGYVAVVDGRFLMTASRCAYPLPEYAGGCGTAEVLLSSTDGITWMELGTVATEPDAAGGFYEDERGLFATGSRQIGDVTEPGVWRSLDRGLNWDFITDPSFTTGRCVGDYGGYVGGIVSDGADLVAIGTGIWHSTDGVTWNCIAPTPRIGISYGHDMFVGTGSNDPSSLADWFWYSTDGVKWQKTHNAPIDTDVVSVGAGFVAVGGGDKYSPPTQLLTSSDGQSWTQQPYPFGDADIQLTASDGNRAIVIEHDYSGNPGEAEPGAIWVSSSDGASWTRYQLPPRNGDDAESVALLGNEIVVTGSSYNGGNSDGAGVIWVAQIP